MRLLGLDEPSLISGDGNNAVSDPDACGGGWTQVPESEYADFKRFGFNSVRLGISWANLEPTEPSGGGATHRWNGPYLKALDAEVKGFTSNGIAVILDMHGNNTSPAFKSPRTGRCEGSGLPSWLYPNAGSISAHRGECDFLTDRAQPGVSTDPQQGYAAAWQAVSGRYASNPLVVAADMYNEPSSHCAGLDLNRFYTRVGQAIRAGDPHVLLIYQDNTAKRGQYALDRPLTLPGSVYSFHVYASSWDRARSAIEAHLSHASSWDAPTWIGEFGVYRGHGAAPSGVAAATAAWAASVLPQFTAFCREHDIGWAYHQYSGGKSALIAPGTGKPSNAVLAGLQSGF